MVINIIVTLARSSVYGL